MKFEELQSEWAADCEISDDQLDHAALGVAKLHAKYWNYYANERRVLRELQAQFDEIQELAHDYYEGKLNDDQEILDKYWKNPFPYNPIVNIEARKRAVSRDKFVIAYAKRVGLQNDKVDFLKSIIDSFKNRGMNIASAIKFRLFKESAYH